MREIKTLFEQELIEKIQGWKKDLEYAEDTDVIIGLQEEMEDYLNVLGHNPEPGDCSPKS